MSRRPRYICAECRHAGHLTAAADAIAFGPIGDDGELAAHDSVDDTFLHESSIQCTEHPDARWYKLIDGVYHEWENCPAEDCIGGTVPPSSFTGWRREACRRCHGEGGRFVPVPGRVRVAARRDVIA
jgi:hypothetical protein